MDDNALTGPDDPELLRRLVALSVTLNSTLEPSQLLRVLLTTAAELLDCEKASILLYNEQRGDLTFVASADAQTEQLAEIPVPLDGSVAGTIFRSGEPLIINDVANDPRHFKTVGERTQFHGRSLLGVPMRRRGQTTGVLEALNRRGGDFTMADARVLDVIASQAAVAIHNAQLVQDLRCAHAELSRVDQVKSRFMALASHELRTPLAIIMSYAEFLRQDTQSTHATRVLEAALRQREIIESMTNMNLLQLGAIDLKLAPVALAPVIDGACAELRRQAEAKQQQLTVRAAAVEVRGDVERLALVFAKIVENAVRFTPKGGAIELAIETTGSEVRVSVRDNGVGIPPGELANVFKDFYQVQDHMTRRHGGLGLGLAIARGIVQLHGGRIWAESAGVNQGATIHVVLPRCA